jgi:hypothetical protein
MTKKQLVEQLSKYPDNMEVFIRMDGEEFSHYPLESVEQRNIRFSEGGETGPVAYDDVIVLDIEI